MFYTPFPPSLKRGIPGHITQNPFKIKGVNAAIGFFLEKISKISKTLEMYFKNSAEIFRK